MRVYVLGLLCGVACAQAPAPAGYDWGMVRAYFSGGTVLSSGNADFSKQDIFLGFTLDKTWRYRPRGPHARMMVASFFDARLTSLPVDADGSHRAALVSGGVYVPFVTTEWMLGPKDRQALFIAPLIKAGFEGAAASAGAGSDLFRFYAAGARLGHIAACGTEGVAPETLSYLDATWSRWAGLAGRPWRLTVEGRLKVPATPLMVGFDATSGSGHDDLKILLGTRFDIGKLAQKLQVPQP